MSLHTLLQILSLTLFEKLPLKQAVVGVEPIETNPAFHRQLNYSSFNRTLLPQTVFVPLITELLSLAHAGTQHQR